MLQLLQLTGALLLPVVAGSGRPQLVDEANPTHSALACTEVDSCSFSVARIAVAREQGADMCVVEIKAVLFGGLLPLGSNGVRCPGVPSDRLDEDRLVVVAQSRANSRVLIKSWARDPTLETVLEAHFRFRRAGADLRAQAAETTNLVAAIVAALEKGGQDAQGLAALFLEQNREVYLAPDPSGGSVPVELTRALSPTQVLRLNATLHRPELKAWPRRTLLLALHRAGLIKDPVRTLVMVALAIARDVDAMAPDPHLGDTRNRQLDKHFCAILAPFPDEVTDEVLRRLGISESEFVTRQVKLMLTGRWREWNR